MEVEGAAEFAHKTSGLVPVEWEMDDELAFWIVPFPNRYLRMPFLVSYLGKKKSCLLLGQ